MNIQIADRNPQVFIKTVETYRNDCGSLYHAWERAESEHREITGRHRYADYDSFLRTRRRAKNG